MEPIIVSIPGEKSPEKAKEEALLASCKYYKGEDANPFSGIDQDKSMFWEYEKLWVGLSLNDSSFSEELKQLDKAGLGDFGVHQPIPLSLVALLYNRYDHWLEGSPDDFMVWFANTYLS